VKDYHINVFYSEEAQAYIADIPDLARCSATGRTPAEALAEVEKAKHRWLETASAEEKPIPEPRYRPEIYNSAPVIMASPPPGLTPVSADQRYDKDLKYIEEKISQHQCILFLGSAIHIPPPADLTQYNYPQTKAPPIGSQLSKYLAEKSDYPAPDWWNLQRVAQHFETEFKSRFMLVEEIKKAVHVGREPSPILRMLADLEFPIVITTNYDHLYEQALDQKAAKETAAGRTATQYQVSIYSPNNISKSKTVDCLPNPDPKRPYILKIHGDVDMPESIVLTDEDYIQFVLRMSDKQPFHPFGNNVLAHLMKWPTLFIGYSLMDYNLRLLFKTLRWKLDAARIPPTYSVDKTPDDLIRDVWERQRRYVSFIVLNLWDCIPKLHAAVRKEPLP
jgi:predicted RNase H-like HicB family nuclease